jgi:hypothetical protein
MYFYQNNKESESKNVLERLWIFCQIRILGQTSGSDDSGVDVVGQVRGPGQKRGVDTRHGGGTT